MSTSRETPCICWTLLAACTTKSRNCNDNIHRTACTGVIAYSFHTSPRVVHRVGVCMIYYRVGYIFFLAQWVIIRPTCMYLILKTPSLKLNVIQYSKYLCTSNCRLKGFYDCFIVIIIV
jgi:hypothetical protein